MWSAADNHPSEPSRTGLGVPVTIWPGLPAAPGAGPVTLAAAERVIAAFSRPGDLVAAIDGSTVVIEAAAAAGRHVLGFIVCGDVNTELRCRLDPQARPFARMRPGSLAQLLAAGDPDAAQAALAITSNCPGPSTCANDGQGHGLLYAASERVLRPGGVLAVITTSHSPGTQIVGDAGQAVAHARAAGLIYAQHIVLMHAAISGDQLAPDPTAAAIARPGGIPIHSDLLVFTKPGSPVSSAELRDPQREPAGQFPSLPGADPWVRGQDESSFS